MKRRLSRISIQLCVLLIVIALLSVVAHFTLRADKLPLGATGYIVPVYGQSLALGEETTLITDVKAYGEQTQHRVKSEFLNERIGYYADKLWKQRFKSVFHHENRHLESSVFGLGECFVKIDPNSKIYLGTFPDGQGEKKISLLGKGTKP